MRGLELVNAFLCIECNCIFCSALVHPKVRATAASKNPFLLFCGECVQQLHNLIYSFPRTEITVFSATKDIIKNFPFFFLSINIITFIFMKIKKALLIWCFTNFFRVARDTEMTVPFGCGGRFEPPAFIYKMLSNTDFASTDFVSHLSQFSAFGICVLRIGLYLRMYSPSFSPISASLSAYRRLLA